MADWYDELSTALASGDATRMQAMLARVPSTVLQGALPYLAQLAETALAQGRPAEALVYYDQIIAAAPAHLDAHAGRVRALLALARFAQARAGAERLVALAPRHALAYRLQADAHAGLDEPQHALAAYRQALRLEPDDAETAQRLQALQAAQQQAAVLRQVLDPATPQEAPPQASPPGVVFDPALLGDPAIPASFDTFRVDGLRQHLRRYSAQRAPGNALARLADPAWLAAWDTALAGTAGRRVLFCGSELGVFALRALQHGAAQVRCEEAFALEARIADGMAQKHFLAAWHAQHGEVAAGWTEAQRRTSFEQFAQGIDVVTASPETPAAQDCDCIVFPSIDHTLLGTGIVAAVRRHARAGARVLPARATVFAMGIAWRYPDAACALEAINALRWSPYPQPLDLPPGLWQSLTEPTRVGQIDLADFREADWDIALPATTAGTVDAIVFWFELDLGEVCISNAPDSPLCAIRPAVQYTDPIALQPGEALQTTLRITSTRLHFETRPAPSLPRTRQLPGWYVPMLGDARRNQGYREALTRALATRPDALVLDIGAGCGLLSLLAASAGAGRVIGCEAQRALAEAGRAVIGRSGLADRVTLLHRDCRKLQLPDDLPRRADLALFELFDCSLIGEGVLHFLAHAREHLLAADACYLPAAARIRAQVIEYRIERIWEIDATLLNPYRAAPGSSNVDAARLGHRALSAPFDVFAFDFASAGPAPQQQPISVPALAPGMAGAVLFWFDLNLDGEHWLSNAPDSGDALHWKQGLQLLPEVRVAPGMPLPLLARHDGSNLAFAWQDDALPQEGRATTPRYDPRWLAAAAELEQHTRNLLQHCAANPDEYAKVAQIAQRMAIDPAAHGLDPVIAQRFAGMFLEG
ncbi:tetratricopeptide repeat protein [Chitiniphilus purpureus]|uniref:Tetratricopeptide repeat protein n=1 Tax=Chitiniphilus purpureus TaxID=2981137 RepID=A0ABY6DWI0_9NEIS|nr:tetratricopeptide repeat protein [Chitiniphilus sp. CD1]UXY16198.1 tetratricopeptide repeat protein [Chitiniphilus sp. CD1]